MPGGMRIRSIPTRGRAVCALMIAAAFLPVAAQGAVGAPGAKTLNAKPAGFAFAPCREAAAVGAGASRVALDRGASALDRMRSRQEGRPAAFASTDAPVAVAAAPALVPASPRACDAAAAAAGGGRSLDTAVDSTELGTIAIPVDHTRFDARWNRVRRAAPVPLMQAELRRAGVTRDLDEREILSRVNRSVNHAVAYVDDDRNYGESDFWATASETIARGRGDCEDLAILKMQMLRVAGIDDDRMKLVLLRDLALGADHALLLVRSPGGWLALDNMTDRLYGAGVGDMRPILSFSGARRWVHGYRDIATGPILAALPAAAAPASPFADNPRGTAAKSPGKRTAAHRPAHGWSAIRVALARTAPAIGRRQLFPTK